LRLKEKFKEKMYKNMALKGEGKFVHT